MRTGEQIIADVAETVTERRKGYGHPAENFRSIAIGWQEILKCEVTARQVALCMDWLKSCRLISQPDHEDSVLDKMGYAMCYADCGGEPEQEQKTDTADMDAPAFPAWAYPDCSLIQPDAPVTTEPGPTYPDWMTFQTCEACHAPVQCKSKGACREASRDPA